ncbi:EamA-like transporter family protein OS=Stutzerimonas stutzeri OX=316 GN=CXK95_03605 PE=4 SV=1 [Stutzerimonas stutzeri]
MSAVAWWLLALPFIAGAFMPLQAGINGQWCVS